jgi:hypothetical protein
LICRIRLCFLFFLLLWFFLVNVLLILSGLFYDSFNGFVEFFISHFLRNFDLFGLVEFLFLQGKIIHDFIPQTVVVRAVCKRNEVEDLFKGDMLLLLISNCK